MHAQQDDADANGREKDILNYHLKGGKILADISPGEEIVVSGRYMKFLRQSCC